MKRKISLLIAVVMVLSFLPAMSVSAATTSVVQRGSGSVADDFAWRTSTSMELVPYLTVRADSSSETMEGRRFTVSLRNGGQLQC